MARRKDHSPEELKALILQAAENIINSKGLDGLTARALAKSIGYAPGTIYNFYRDMDALIMDINYGALGRLHSFCSGRLQNLPPDFSKIKTLAYAYVDFAHENARAWETLFSNPRGGKKTKVPKHYQQRLLELFQLIENVLRECVRIPPAEIADTARLLWASLHGITVLTLDGRLSLAGVETPHALIDDLLRRYLAEFIPEAGSAR